jgi:hypothetical protein
MRTPLRRSVAQVLKIDAPPSLQDRPGVAGVRRSPGSTLGVAAAIAPAPSDRLSSERPMSRAHSARLLSQLTIAGSSGKSRRRRKEPYRSPFSASHGRRPGRRRLRA